jgi:hypothetical protein
MNCTPQQGSLELLAAEYVEQSPQIVTTAAGSLQFAPIRIPACSSEYAARFNPQNTFSRLILEITHVSTKMLPFFRFKLGVNPTHAILENVNGGYFNMVQGSFFHQAPSVVRSICSRKFLSCLARVCGSPFRGKVSHSSSTKGRKKTSPPGKETCACHSCGANAFLIGGAIPENFKWRVSAHENKWHKDGTNSGLPYSNHMHPYAAFNMSC